MLSVAVMLALAKIGAGSGTLGFILPVPLTVLVATQGVPAGLLVIGLFLVSWVAIAGIGMGFVSLVPILAVGLIYGFGLRDRRPPGLTILVGVLGMSTGLLLELPGLKEIWAAWRSSLHMNVDSTMEMYRRSGLLENLSAQGIGLEQLRTSTERLAEHLARLFPAFVLWDVAITAIAAYFLGRWLVSRWHPVPSPSAFRNWQLPWPLVWVVITGLAVWLWGDYRGNTLMLLIGENLLVGFTPLLLITGLAVIGYLGSHWNVPMFFKSAVVIFVILFSLPLGLAVVLFIGLFDPLLDFRRFARHGGGDKL